MTNRYRITYKRNGFVKFTILSADNAAAAAAKFHQSFRGAKIWGIRPA